MLKSYEELRKIDVLPYCEYRDARDESGKKIKVPYLNWAKCKDLLHENGAKQVYFEPLLNSNGSSLFMTTEAFVDSKGNKNRCFEVRVKIAIDELEFTQNYPLLNGVYVVREDTINQLRLSNAQARAFVKGVAIRTGLGFGLWLKEDEITPKSEVEDLYFHDIIKIRERVQRILTVKLDAGLTEDGIAEALGLDSKEDINERLRQYGKLANFEKAIQEI